MQDPTQQALASSGRERWFRFHLMTAKEAFDQAKKEDSREALGLSLSHARVAINVAKKAKRLDLEKDAQLAISVFLRASGREHEAWEAAVIAASIEDNRMMEYELQPGRSSARLVSVSDIPIDEVIRGLQSLENGGPEQEASHSGQKQTPAVAGPQTSEDSESADICGPQKSKFLPKAAFEGRQIRDLHGRLATVLTEAPRLRYKANFSN